MKLLSGTKKKQRQANALKRLENQLKSGVKVMSDKTWGKLPITKVHNGETVDLSEQDINRINKEIAILKQRIA